VVVVGCVYVVVGCVYVVVGCVYVVVGCVYVMCENERVLGSQTVGVQWKA
jgi:hypothetical protein